MDYREGNPALTRGLDNATSILSLICLVAMVLGAIGVAMAMHAHLEQRMDMLAILKAVGADSSDLLRIFLLQTLGLGLAGALLGVAAGVGVMVALPAAFGNLLPVHVAFQFPWQSALAGMATGLLTTLLFCLPPLLDVRAVRPVLVLRRLVEQGPPGIGGWFARWWARRLQLGIAAAVVAALGAIAWALSDSAKVGAWFALLFTVALVVLLAMAAVALRIVRFLLDRTRLRLPSSLRHGLANLYRPGNQSAAVLAALGTGVMLILAVYLMQKGLLRDLRETASPSLPNVFLVDVRTDEVAGVKAFFAQPTGRQPAADDDSRSDGPIHLHQRRAGGRDERPALSAAHAGERGTQLGRCAARGRQSDPGRVVDERQRAADRGERRRGQTAAPRRGLRDGTRNGRSHAGAERGRDLSRRRPAPGRARAVCFAFGANRQ